MKQFEDLVFKQHPVFQLGIQAQHNFDNGNWISVVGGGSLYGDGIITFEVMSTHTEPNVAPHQTKEQVTEMIKKLK